MSTTSTVSAHDESPSALHDLRAVVADLWRSRELLYQLTLRDIRIRYKQAVMGFGWAIFTPLLVVAAGVIVRIALLNVSGAPFELSSATGVLVKGLAWSFFSGAIGFATNVLTLNSGLIGKVYFPRETLPMSVLLTSAFDSLIASAALSLLLPFTGWVPTWSLLWLPLLVALLFLFTLAVALFSSCANLFFRDVKYLVQIVISFGIFFTPVFYEPQLLGARTVPLQMLNPLAPIMEGLRLAVAHGHNLLTPLVAADGALVWTPAYLLYTTVITLVSLMVSAVIFHRAQDRFAEYI